LAIETIGHRKALEHVPILAAAARRAAQGLLGPPAGLESRSLGSKFAHTVPDTPTWLAIIVSLAAAGTACASTAQHGSACRAGS
jgi:hypothetical protein